MTDRSSEAAAERYARYIELRDSGVHLADAARELDVAVETAYKYERSYRQLRQLPRKSMAPWRGGT